MYTQLHLDLFEFIKRNDWKSVIENTTDDFTFKATNAGLTFDRDEFFTIADTLNQLIRQEFKLHKIIEINNYTLGIVDIIVFDEKTHKKDHRKEYTLARWREKKIESVHSYEIETVNPEIKEKWFNSLNI